MRYTLLLLGSFLAPATAVGQVAGIQVPSGAEYVASSEGRVYYWVACDDWRRLARANLIFFRTPEEARTRGYTPSTAQGCGGPPDRPRHVGPGRQEPLQAETPPVGAAVPSRSGGTCVIARIIDGDTVDCATGERVRLGLIDAPEMDQAPYGERARAALLALMPVGTTTSVELDVQEKDRYGRVLGYLYLPDGRMVNEELARRGYGVASVYPPNLEHVDRIRAAAQDARKAELGLWATVAFQCEPAQHRAGRC